MKRISWIWLVIGLAGAAWAGDLWLSSYTTTADTMRQIRATPVVLHGVIIGTPGAAGTSVTIYNSQAAASSIVSVLEGTTVYFHPFDIYLSSGLTYTKTGVGAVTFLFH